MQKLKKKLNWYLKKIIGKSRAKIFKQKFKRFLYKPYRLYMASFATNPVSDYHGYDRGTPIDRFYIENFLRENSEDIQGVCLEFLENNYIQKFGGGRVSRGDIIDIDAKNKSANIIADIREAGDIPDNTYDCIILTQVLQFIDNLEAAIYECTRILRRGGVILATMPAVSRIDPLSTVEGDYWRFTEASVNYIFSKFFDAGKYKISSAGNLRASMMFLSGYSLEEVPSKVLSRSDSNFPLLIMLRAVKL